jgi:hypothetical protein
VANGSGAVNLTGLTKASTPFGGPSAIAADIGFILTGAPSGGISDGYFGLTGSTSFGSGDVFLPNTGSGDLVGFTLIIGGAGVPDGGSTVSLLGCALLGLAALRRKLGC